jgi:predicted RNA-binding Zn-ribbon protein involved in translation (DUF1610 family)
MTTFLIDHHCPQCGAPAVLEETDRLYRCQYCKVSSYLMRRGIFRYLLPHQVSPDKGIYYMPYWRFKGMYFYCTIDGAENRFLDLSYQAFESAFFPVSLGFRSQALKLAFATPNTPGRFIRPTRSLTEATRLFDARFRNQISKTIYHQEYIGETISLIYSPYYHEGTLNDAVLKKPTRCMSQDLDLLPSELPHWPVEFLPTLCPSCGWDLEGAKDSLVLICRNCDSVWLPRQHRFRRISFSTVPGKGESFLPFWQVEAVVSGLNLTTLADFVRIANLPKVIQQNWHERAFQFWSLAFKVRPSSFMQLNCGITLLQPQPQQTDTLPEGLILPVSLPLLDAFESLKLTLGSLLRPRKHYLPLLSSVKITPRNFRLVLIPFRTTSHEYYNEDLHIAVNKNQLRLASNL